MGEIIKRGEIKGGNEPEKRNSLQKGLKANGIIESRGTICFSCFSSLDYIQRPKRFLLVKVYNYSLRPPPPRVLRNMAKWNELQFL